MTEEQKAARREALNRGRETAARNRALKVEAAAKAAPEPVAAAPIVETEDVADTFVAPQAVVPGGVRAAPPPEDLDAEPDDVALSDPISEGYELFVLSLDAETIEMLSDVELREIFDAQMLKVKAEKKATVKKAATERALHAARVGEGLIPVASADAVALMRRNNEMVTFTVDLPEMGDIGLRIDQRLYLHGYTYTVTRAEYDSFRDISFRAQQAELDFEGKNKSHWLRRKARGSVNSDLTMGHA